MKYSCNACGRYVEGSCDCYRPTQSNEDYLRATVTQQAVKITELEGRIAGLQLELDKVRYSENWYKSQYERIL